MPLYKTITAAEGTRVYIWKITETFDELNRDVILTTHCRQRVMGMKSEIHQRGFMSVRQLLAVEGYTDSDLFYDEEGKPHLKDGTLISITHSFSFSAIILSDKQVGIDIEQQRPKILRIARKFTPVSEYRTIANEDALIRKLTIVWCAKESLYKSFATRGVSFLDHIRVADFNLDSDQTVANVDYLGKQEEYAIRFLEFEGYSCAFATLEQPA